MPFYYGWVIVVGAFLGTFIGGGLQSFTFSVFLQPMSEDLGWSRTVLTGALAFRLITAASLAPIFGPMVDKYGPRFLMVAAAVIGGVAAVLLSRVTEIWQFYAIFAFIGMSGGAGAGRSGHGRHRGEVVRPASGQSDGVHHHGRSRARVDTGSHHIRYRIQLQLASGMAGHGGVVRCHLAAGLFLHGQTAGGPWPASGRGKERSRGRRGLPSAWWFGVGVLLAVEGSDAHRGVLAPHCGVRAGEPLHLVGDPSRVQLRP